MYIIRDVDITTETENKLKVQMEINGEKFEVTNFTDKRGFNAICREYFITKDLVRNISDRLLTEKQTMDVIIEVEKQIDKHVNNLIMTTIKNIAYK